MFYCLLPCYDGFRKKVKRLMCLDPSFAVLKREKKIKDLDSDE
jgi:hypothetical protein